MLMMFQVTGVMTQGRGDGTEWVTRFMVSYSMDAYHWNYVVDTYGNQWVSCTHVLPSSRPTCSSLALFLSPILIPLTYTLHLSPSSSHCHIFSTSPLLPQPIALHLACLSPFLIPLPYTLHLSPLSSFHGPIFNTSLPLPHPIALYFALLSFFLISSTYTLHLSPSSSFHWPIFSTSLPLPHPIAQYFAPLSSFLIPSTILCTSLLLPHFIDLYSTHLYPSLILLPCTLHLSPSSSLHQPIFSSPLLLPHPIDQILYLSPPVSSHLLMSCILRLPQFVDLYFVSLLQLQVNKIFQNMHLWCLHPWSLKSCCMTSWFAQRCFRVHFFCECV